MARNAQEKDLSPTIDAFKGWSERCLVGDTALFATDALWTTPLIGHLRKAFTENPDLGKDDFITKLRGQMKDSSPAAQRLMGEMLWALLLFPSNIKPETKRQQIRAIYEMSNEPLPGDNRNLTDDVLHGIGSGGPGFNNHRWRELAFLIEIASSIKTKRSDERQHVLTDYEAFMGWIDSVPQEGSRQYRHMLRYLAFPDRVERMSSNRDRRRVLQGYGVAPKRVTTQWSDRQLDDALLALRRSLEAEHPAAVLDFYEPPLSDKWRLEEADDLTEDEEETEGRSSGERVWIEKTHVQGRPDRESGEYAVGQMLWSPMRSTNGGDIYRFMREVQPNDLVLHLTDNEGITGISVAMGVAEDFVGLPGTDWAGRPAYKIRLKDFQRLQPPLSRQTLFSEPIASRLASLISTGQQNLFYNSRLELNQGAYLTPASEELVRILNDAYMAAAGKPLVAGLDENEPEPTTTTDEPEPTALEDLEAIVENFAETLRQAFLDFGPGHRSLVRAFIASLATKRFVILTGLSGSGKSQIAIKFGQWLGSGAHKVVAVRPDWTGPEALLGYEDVFRKGADGRQGWYVPDALEFMLKAANDHRRPYALVLDEMNLAHVERYFADALSGMETNEGCLPNLVRDKTGTWVQSATGPARVPFPRNLFVIGTVNVDETTYLFSPKVLDRANTFEFRVATDDLSSAALKPVDAAPGHSALVQGLLKIAVRDDWHLANPTSWLGEYVEQLRTLHKLLAESSLEFGHRAHYEAIRFASLHAAAGDPAMNVALDRQILQKILPRIHGSRKRVEPSLCALAQFCWDMSWAPTASAAVSKLPFDPTREDLSPALLPLSFDKVRRMVQTVRANQFTSFTD